MMRTVRFLAGLALVAVGVGMAAPFLTRAAQVILDAPAAGASSGMAAWAGAAPGGGLVPPSPGAGGYVIPDPRGAPGGPAFPPPAPALAPPPAPSSVPEAPMVIDAQPLPVRPADVTLAPPAFPSQYRSTLDVPPPPLLDVDAAAPLVVGEPGAAAGPIRTVSAQMPVATGALTYAVRDGDDLTGIAARLYGHPGAAEAIWNANRDRLTDPALLPIGTVLRLPPSWAPAASRSPASSALVEPARRPSRVLVGPGETLESLAQRFYGDKAWADRLWEANRDQLRSPQLLVAGMELRLP